MSPTEQRKFLAYFHSIDDHEKKVEVLMGVLKAERKREGGFRLLDLTPKGKTISMQAIKDALKGKGNAQRRPGCISDLVRQNAAMMLWIPPEELWPNLYK